MSSCTQKSLQKFVISHSSCSPGCPGTHSVGQAGLKLRNPPAFASQVLGLKACVTTAWQHVILIGLLLYVTRPFPLVAFNILSLSSIFSVLGNVCQGNKATSWRTREINIGRQMVSTGVRDRGTRGCSQCAIATLDVRLRDLICRSGR